MSEAYNRKPPLQGGLNIKNIEENANNELGMTMWVLTLRKITFSWRVDI